MENLGATVIDPGADDLAAAAYELSSGRGVDVFFDAAGVGAVITQGIDALGLAADWWWSGSTALR